MNSDFFDFGLCLPGRTRRHPTPLDDHRLANAKPDDPGETRSDEPSNDRRSDEPAEIDCPGVWEMKITQSAHREMLDYFLSRQPEAAGILLGPVQDDLLVTHFLPDEEGTGTSASFHINAPGLNRILKRVRPAGLNGKGLAHSHPAGIPQPSYGDLTYVRQLLGLPGNADAQQCFLPIVCDRRLYAYVYARGRLWRADLILV